MPKIRIVSPIYFDTESYLQLRHRLRTALDECERVKDVHFVAIDDSAGADPDIGAVADHPDTRVITPPYNLGHQGAIVYALRAMARDLGSDDIVVTMDSDGEDRPEDVPMLLRPLLDAPNDQQLIIVARRTHRRETPAFKVLYAAFRLTFRLLTGTVIRSGNFAAAWGSLIRRTITHPSFDQCYSSSLVSLPFRRVFVPLARGERYYGRSRMGYVGLITHGVHMLMPFLDRIAVRCLIAFAAFLTLGIAGSLGLIFLQVLGRVSAPEWAMYLMLVLILLNVLALSSALTLFAVSAQSKARSVRELELMRDGERIRGNESGLSTDEAADGIDRGSYV